MKRWWWGAVVVVVLAGCDDTLFGVAGDTGGGGGQGFCAVTGVFDAHCTSCHSPAGGTQGALDLQTDPYGALVDAASAYPGRTLVTAGDSAGSFLIVKLRGDQAGTEGGTMPPGTPLDSGTVDAIAAWIDAGATQECGGGTDTGSFSCDDRNESCGPPGTCGADESSAMLPGSDCLACHYVGHSGEGPDFTAAGTAFADLGGSAPLAGAKVHITDDNGQELTLTTNAVGNFYTSTALAMPFTASIEVGGTTLEMVSSPTTGACNSCHACDGAAGGKLHGP